jgi:GAF domain-containing protein
MNDRFTIPRLDRSGGNARRYAIYGALFGLGFPVVAVGLALTANRLPLGLAAIIALHINQPLLWIIDTAPFFLAAFAAIAGGRQDAVEALNSMLATQARDLASSQRSLEQRMEQRTVELEQRNIQLRRAVQITRKISRIRDSAELANASVLSIAENFGDFVVDLYLIDDRRTEAVLAASSDGRGTGEELAVRSFKVGEASLIGQVAGSGDVGRSLTGERGPELALPLLSRGLPLGVLHIRGLHEGVVLPVDTDLFQLIADQLASAIETARSFREANEALEQLKSVSGQSIQDAWRQGLPKQTLSYEYTPSGTRPARAPMAETDPDSLRIPLELRGQRIGTIALTPKETGMWTDADRDLAEKAAAQVTLALENVRLLDETRDRAQTEQLLSEFSTRLNQSVNLDTLLQTAVRELAALPDVAGASIYLKPELGPGEHGLSPSKVRD